MKTKLIGMMALLAGSTLFAAPRVVVGLGFGTPAPAYGYVAPVPPPPAYPAYAAPAPAYSYVAPAPVYASPYPGGVWVDGYWGFSGPARVWHPGYWRRGPEVRREGRDDFRHEFRDGRRR